MHPRRRCRGSSKGLSTTPGGDERKLELVGKQKQPTKTTLDSSVFTKCAQLCVWVCLELGYMWILCFWCTRTSTFMFKHASGSRILGTFFFKKPAPNKTSIYMYRKWKQLVGVCRGVKLIRDTPSVRNPASPGLIVSPCFVIHVPEASV